MSRLDSKTIVGVIGAGTMGRGIAQVAAQSGHRALVYDTRADACKEARADLEKVFTRLVDKGRVEQSEAGEILERIQFVDTIGNMGDCRLVVEAVVEELEAKKSLFAALEDIVSTEAVLATNTSSLSVAAISSACERPGRVLGVHFFNPAPLMPLVEIVPGVRTDDNVVKETRGFVDGWGKKTVLAKDTPGFIVNRVARPFYGEALRVLEEGIADVATIDYAMKSCGGFKMGPFELMDFIGNDINFTVTETVFAAFFFDPRYRPSFTQKRLVEAGLLGRKTGAGFYDYADDAATPAPRGDEKVCEEIFMRVLVMLINEAADALFWGVATRDDIDLAMTAGVNYPRGLLEWADEVGIDAVLERLTSLQDTYSEDRYRPSPLLRRMAEDGRRFYG